MPRVNPYTRLKAETDKEIALLRDELESSRSVITKLETEKVGFKRTIDSLEGDLIDREYVIGQAGGLALDAKGLLELVAQPWWKRPNFTRERTYLSLSITAFNAAVARITPNP